MLAFYLNLQWKSDRSDAQDQPHAKSARLLNLLHRSHILPSTSAPRPKAPRYSSPTAANSLRFSSRVIRSVLS